MNTIEEQLAEAEHKIEILIEIIVEMQVENSMVKWQNDDNREEEFARRKVNFFREIKARF